MTAPSQIVCHRNRLTAAVWNALSTRCDYKCQHCAATVPWVMANVDAYADAVAEDRIRKMTAGELRARLRLAEATAETAGSTP